MLDRCGDRSREIARGFTDRLVEGAWEREGPRRHAGIDACRGDWILEIDADERVTPELAEEIRQVVAGLAGRLAPGPGRQLYRRSAGALGLGRLLRPVGPCRRCSAGAPSNGATSACIRRCRCPACKAPHCPRASVHYVDRDISDMLRRLDRYTSARAQDLRDSGDIGSYGHNLRRIPSRFWKCYVGRRGYREGPYGFLIALCAALYPILSYLKARLDPPATPDARPRIASEGEGRLATEIEAPSEQR